MTVRDHLRDAIAGVPDGGAVTLPVAAVRRWLQEDLEEAEHCPAGGRSYTTA